ncbi:HAMP domain-containing sensor histidine kinase [Botrimarina sp.]|uniref:sensor histidine kinase n=1 Tax=Botrimarina sp. TaxID=2795802 RepID=UPI0032EDE8DD
MSPPEPISDELRRWFEQRLRDAKLDAMKELAYGASHEINNPLANIALRAQTLLKREDDPDKRKALEAMHRAAMRAHEMISDLMLFARPPEPQRQAIDLLEVARSVVEGQGPLADERGVLLEVTEDSTPAPAWADRDQLIVALRAVVQNSLDATEGEGAVLVRVCATGDAGLITVEDDGQGVPDEVLPHVFDPFFSGREAGRGLGFGLTKCWRIVTLHGGDVLLENRPEGGVRVVMSLPLA